MYSVLILLSTYNGEKFLVQQLESLYNQKNVDVNILVRDDGSTDDSLAILNEFKNKYGKMTILCESNIGVAQSFYRLMNYAVTCMPRYDFYAFCDQDDVWFDCKLEKSISFLAGPSDDPKMFFSNAQLVDADLQPISERKTVKVKNDFYALFVSNRSLGCTQVMNFALLEQSSKINELIPIIQKKGLKLPLHDCWTIRVAYSLGAKVFYYDKPLMFYRQHSHNVVGGANTSKLKLISNRLKRYFKDFTKQKSLCCKCLLMLYCDKIPAKRLRIIKSMSNYDKSIIDKIRILFCKRLYQYGIVENIGLIGMIVLNKF